MLTQHAHTSDCWWNREQARWICDQVPLVQPDPERSSASLPDPPLVDVRDMIVVHTAMLREFRLAPAAVHRVEPGASRRAAVVDRHLGFLCDLLHHHHEGEDSLLWPPLRERMPAAAITQLDAAESQHVDIDAALHRVADARTLWRGDPSESNRTCLVTDLEHLHTILKAHLELEERTLLPLAATLLTEAEWLAVGDAAAEALPKTTLVLAFGMFSYEGDPVVLKAMLASAPALPRVLIPRIAPHVYARRAHRIHGTSRP
ncbi:MAG: hemerythrin domain-containing protein [Terracoccus sp.]